MERKYYIYKITNQVNGKVYIGQTVSLKHRWQDHKRAMKKPTQVIHHAFVKYGIDKFEFEWIASCLSQDAANEVETLMVAHYNSLVPNGYNVTLGGYNAPKTYEWLEQKRLRDEKIWLEFCEKNKDQIIKLYLEDQLNVEEIEQFIGCGYARIKRILDENHILRQNKAGEKLMQWRLENGHPIPGNKGKKASPELRKKLSEAHIGKQSGEKHPMFGRKHSEETKEKMRQAKLKKNTMNNKKETI